MYASLKLYLLYTIPVRKSRLSFEASYSASHALSGAVSRYSYFLRKSHSFLAIMRTSSLGIGFDIKRHERIVHRKAKQEPSRHRRFLSKEARIPSWLSGAQCQPGAVFEYAVSSSIIFCPYALKSSVVMFIRNSMLSLGSPRPESYILNFFPSFSAEPFL